MRNYKSIVFVLCSVAIIGVWSCKTTKPVVEPNKVENIKPAEINEELAMGKILLIIQQQSGKNK